MNRYAENTQPQNQPPDQHIQTELKQKDIYLFYSLMSEDKRLYIKDILSKSFDCFCVSNFKIRKLKQMQLLIHQYVKY